MLKALLVLAVTLFSEPFTIGTCSSFFRYDPSASIESTVVTKDAFTVSPNPFNPSITITSSHEIKIYSIDGKLVETMKSGAWKPNGLCGGFYIVKSGGIQKKILYIK